jgi:hypothetical protein
MHSEGPEMSDHDSEPEPNVDEVETRLRDLRRHKKVRWTMSRETAEMAIAALAMARNAAPEHRRSGKSRRRKRGKRLL